MSYYLDGKLAALEDAVCADAYFEGLGSLGMTSAQRVQAENRQWNYIRTQAAGAPNQMIFKPTVIGGGVGDRVREGKGWRDRRPDEARHGTKPAAGGNMQKQREAERQRDAKAKTEKERAQAWEKNRQEAHDKKLAEQAQRQKELWGGQKSAAPSQASNQTSQGSRRLTAEEQAELQYGGVQSRW